MAKRTTGKTGKGGGKPRAEKPATTAGAVKVITEAHFKSLIASCRAAQSAMDAERGSLGGLISDAAANKALHKGAFAIFRRLDKMDPGKRAELLFHWDIYRERAEKRTGPDAWGAQGDMLPDRGEDDGEGEDERTDTERAMDGDQSAESHPLSTYPGVTGDQLQNVGFPDDDGDGDRDLRPRHLREGSAADPNPDPPTPKPH